MIRRAIPVALALIMLVPAVAAGRDRPGARVDQRVPSAQLQVTGSGKMTVVGRLAVNGAMPSPARILIIDRGGDARAHLAGVPLSFNRRGRARVPRAEGILFVSGSNVTVRVIGSRLTFSVAGLGRARLQGEGRYQLNNQDARAWSGRWLRLTPASKQRRRGACARCSPRPAG